MPRNCSYASDIAFTPSVKAVQAARGSRSTYERMEQAGSWATSITPELKSFIEAQTSVFLATANREGQPYVQHRGGPAGILHALNESTIGFADFSGNRQFITLGNLAENPKAHLFLIDYATRRRVKIWGLARAIENDAKLMAHLMPNGYRARPERVVLFTVTAWDINCPQHIPQRAEARDVAVAIAERDQQIAALEAEVTKLRVAAGLSA